MAFVIAYTGDLANGASQSIANENLLLINFRATGADAALAQGSIWCDSTGGIDVLKFYSQPTAAAGAWNEVGAFQHGDLTFSGTNGGELIFAKFEQLGADPAVSASLHGRFWQRTDTLAFRCNVGDATQGTLPVILDTAYLWVDLPLTSWSLGGTAPAAHTLGTSPAVPGYRFTGTTQTICRRVTVPGGWNGSSDLRLKTQWALEAAETNGDALNVTVNLVSVKKQTASNVLSQSSTSATGTKAVATGALAIGTCLEVDITLDYDDGTNPITAGDELCLEISLTNIATIADALFLGARLDYLGAGLTEI